MDKLKEQLSVVTKHSFWIMCGGILIVCLVSWYLSTRALSEQQKKQLAEIKTVFDQVNGVQKSNPQHPNTSTAQGMDQLIKASSIEVMKGWQMQYDQQATVLVWPASFDDDFRQRVDKLRPIEIVPPPPTPIASDLPASDRQLFRNYIELELPTLAKTIGTEWRASSQTAGGGSSEAGYGAGGYGAGGYGAGGYGASGRPSGPITSPGIGPSSYPSGALGESGQPGALVEDKSVVLWSTENQQQLLNTHFGFVARENIPSTLDVLYAQEDLWVLQNIMDIIRTSNRDSNNRDAEARHEAAIKQIDFVRIGRSAMGLAGAVMPIGGTAAGGMGMGMGEGGMAMSSGMNGYPGGGSSMGGSTPPVSSSEGGASAVPSGMSGTPDTMGMMGMNAAMTTDPAYGRYVNEKYEPLDPKRLREAWTSKNPADALLAVAKRMPVRMRFAVDQRRLNKVLAECGNSRLPVEVRQVRINREAATSGGGMGGYGGYPGGSSGYGESAGGSSSYGSMSGSGMPGATMLGGGMSGMSSGSKSYGESGGSSGYPGGGYSSGYGASGMSGRGGMPGTNPLPVGGANSTAAVDHNLVVVELYGIVYIYNPVNKSQLGLEQGATTASAPAAPPSTTPSASPPAAPTAKTAVPPAAIVPAVGSK